MLRRARLGGNLHRTITNCVAFARQHHLRQLGGNARINPINLLRLRRAQNLQIRGRHRRHQIRLHTLAAIRDRCGDNSVFQHAHRHVALADSRLPKRGLISKITQGARVHRQANVVGVLQAEMLSDVAERARPHGHRHLSKSRIAGQGERIHQRCLIPAATTHTVIIFQRRRRVRQGDFG